jgi:Glycogen recognition site of AMP-activated protein kinase
MAEFNQWKGQPMAKEANGIWTIKVSVPPATYRYKFLVDGKDWVFDPKNSNRKTVDGVENSSIEVRGDGNARSTPVASATATVTRQGSMSFGTPAASPTVASSNAKNQGMLSVTPVEISNFEVPLSASERAEAVRSGNPPVTMAKILLGVPNTFDPTLPRAGYQCDGQLSQFEFVSPLSA